MEQRIDALGLVCPKPVILAKKAMDAGIKGDVILITVDNEMAVENLRKLAQSLRAGYASRKMEEKVYEIRLTVEESAGTKADDTNIETMECKVPGNRTLVVLASDKMGEGDEVLGRLLMKGFVYALTQLPKLPETVLLYNSGARLSCCDSESLEDLRTLEQGGVQIFTCGTCLNHYGLAEKLAVGVVTNMYAIVEMQTQADKIIKP